MFLAASLSPLGSTMIAVALPSIGTELGVGGGRLTQWLVSSYLIVGIAAMSPGGRLGDRIGHRRGLVVGMAIFGAGSILGFTVATLPTLALARMAMAAGGAMTVPATMALLRNLVPYERRPRAFGYFGSAMGIAAAIGPLVGGELTARFGWRAVFIANIPVIVVSYALIRATARSAKVSATGVPPGAAQRATPVESSRRPPAFDVLGSILLGLGLALLVIAVQMSGSGVWGTTAAGALILAVFVAWERRVAQPVLDLRMYLKPTFAAASLVIGLQNLAMYSLLFQLPIFFERVRGVEPGAIGRSIIAMMLAMVVCSPLGGRVSERIGTRATALAGTVASLLGVWLIADLQAVQAPGDIVTGLILMGAGLGLSSAPSQAAAMSTALQGDAGMAGGAVSTARYIGAVIGISALGHMLGGRETVIEEHAAATAIYLGALVVAALSTLALPGRRRAGAAA